MIPLRHEEWFRNGSRQVHVVGKVSLKPFGVLLVIGTRRRLELMRDKLRGCALMGPEI